MAMLTSRPNIADLDGRIAFHAHDFLSVIGILRDTIVVLLTYLDDFGDIVSGDVTVAKVFWSKLVVSGSGILRFLALGEAILKNLAHVAAEKIHLRTVLCTMD